MIDEVIEPNILILEIGITLNQCESFFEKHSQLIVLEKVRHEHTGIENNWIFDTCYKGILKTVCANILKREVYVGKLEKVRHEHTGIENIF